MKYRVKVIRKQEWTFTDVEADNDEAARDAADQLALHEPCHDDYAYDTEILSKDEATA